MYNYSVHINTIKNTNATYIVHIQFVHLQHTKIVKLFIQCKPILKLEIIHCLQKDNRKKKVRYFPRSYLMIKIFS